MVCLDFNSKQFKMKRQLESCTDDQITKMNDMPVFQYLGRAHPLFSRAKFEFLNFSRL